MDIAKVVLVIAMVFIFAVALQPVIDSSILTHQTTVSETAIFDGDGNRSYHLVDEDYGLIAVYLPGGGFLPEKSVGLCVDRDVYNMIKNSSRDNAGALNSCPSPNIWNITFTNGSTHEVFVDTDGSALTLSLDQRYGTNITITINEEKRCCEEGWLMNASYEYSSHRDWSPPSELLLLWMPVVFVSLLLASVILIERSK